MMWVVAWLARPDPPIEESPATTRAVSLLVNSVSTDIGEVPWVITYGIEYLVLLDAIYSPSPIILLRLMSNCQ